MASPDLLFGLRNNFYLGAYQAAINNSEISNLSPEEAIERDSLVYRSYIALGSYQVSLRPLPFSDLLKYPVNLLSFYLF
jgi:coatomer subunit epsilon